MHPPIPPGVDAHGLYFAVTLGLTSGAHNGGSTVLVAGARRATCGGGVRGHGRQLRVESGGDCPLPKYDMGDGVTDTPPHPQYFRNMLKNLMMNHKCVSIKAWRRKKGHEFVAEGYFQQFDDRFTSNSGPSHRPCPRGDGSRRGSEGRRGRGWRSADPRGAPWGALAQWRRSWARTDADPYTTQRGGNKLRLGRLNPTARSTMQWRAAREISAEW